MQRIPYFILLDMFKKPLHAHSCIRQQQTATPYGGVGCYQGRLEKIEALPEYEGEVFGETPWSTRLAYKTSVDDEVWIRTDLERDHQGEERRPAGL